ncbi:MAG: toll/interleukin-1 receptor domain-containing protein [Cyanobacteria bacterium P01_G01_bin.39]
MTVESLQRDLNDAQSTLDAFVVVGGTLLHLCQPQIVNCIASRKRLLFPRIDSPWLVSTMDGLGIRIEEYERKIKTNSELAKKLGFDIRFHGQPVGAWYVNVDTKNVYQKAVGILTGTKPELVSLPKAGKQFDILFQNSWDNSDENISSASERAQSSLRIFLSHSSGDKAVVRRLYSDLLSSGFVPWFDEVDLLPGQNFDREIRIAVKQSQVVLVCLSKNSINKTGYIQKEIKYVLDVADHQPEGATFIIPVLLEPCDVPMSMGHLHYVRLFDQSGMEKLVAALNLKDANVK